MQLFHRNKSRIRQGPSVFKRPYLPRSHYWLLSDFLHALPPFFMIGLRLSKEPLIHTTKSLYIRHMKSNFYETEIEIWAGFGPVLKKIRPIMSNFWGRFFHVFLRQKNISIFLKNIICVCTKKLHEMKQKIW